MNGLFSPTPDDNHLIQNDTRVTENTDHMTSDIGSRISESIVDTHMIKLELHDKANLFQNVEYYYSQPRQASVYTIKTINSVKYLTFLILNMFCYWRCQL
jgi:hypothetical protein